MPALVKKKQANLAARALIQVISKSQQSNLLPEEQLLHLTIALKKMPHRSKRYHFIPLKHSLTESKTSEVCVFIKDGEADLEKAIKEDCSEINVTVINLSKLKEEYQTHEAKRQLCASYDRFVADDRIVPLLPRVIGKRFYESKKNPVPVCLTRKSRGRKVLAALKTTVFQLTGSSISVRVGHTGMAPSEIADNVHAAMEGVAPYIPGGAANIQALHLRGNRTVALPLYNSAPTPEDEDLLQDVMPPAKRAKANGKANKGGKSKAAAGDTRKRKAAAKKTTGKKGGEKKQTSPNGEAAKEDKTAGNTKKQQQQQKKKEKSKKAKQEAATKAQEKATPAKQQQANGKGKKTPAKGKGQKKATAEAANKEADATTVIAQEPKTPARAAGKKKNGKGKAGSGAASMPASALKPKKTKKVAQGNGEATGEDKVAAAASAPGSALKSKKKAKAKRVGVAASTPGTPAKKTPAKKTPAKKQKKTPKRTN